MSEHLLPPEHEASTHDTWADLSVEERRIRFLTLPRPEAEELFLSLPTTQQHELFVTLANSARRSWLRLLAPDDAADLIQEFPRDEQGDLMLLLDYTTAREVEALLDYAEDEAGGLMNPRFVRLRPEVAVDVAIRYIRAQARRPVETLQYGYVLDSDQKLLGTVSFRQLLLAPPGQSISAIMTTDLVTAPEELDQEELSTLLVRNGLSAIPVLDDEGRMKGVVTVDDVVSVVEEEATEDFQKLGGSEALDEPYLKISMAKMIRKRGGWLTVLFLGEMLTATAMGYFEHEISRAVVLALFIPLIISSGGNSGSQATSLVIRALALKEVRLKDWWRVLLRELQAGFALGAILGSVGLCRILLWPTRASLYGEHYLLIGLTVAFSLLGIVLWGSIAGSMLPFILRKAGFDPATASAPFVATLVDVTGLIIYFTVASVILSGTLL
jgi:magnesium transporter